MTIPAVDIGKSGKFIEVIQGLFKIHQLIEIGQSVC